MVFINYRFYDSLRLCITENDLWPLYKADTQNKQIKKKLQELKDKEIHGKLSSNEQFGMKSLEKQVEPEALQKKTSRISRSQTIFYSVNPDKSNVNN
jgi:hypothetical protein